MIIFAFHISVNLQPYYKNMLLKIPQKKKLEQNSRFIFEQNFNFAKDLDIWTAKIIFSEFLFCFILCLYFDTRFFVRNLDVLTLFSLFNQNIIFGYNIWIQFGYLTKISVFFQKWRKKVFDSKYPPCAFYHLGSTQTSLNHTILRYHVLAYFQVINQ